MTGFYNISIVSFANNENTFEGLFLNHYMFGLAVLIIAVLFSVSIFRSGNFKQNKFGNNTNSINESSFSETPHDTAGIEKLNVVSSSEVQTDSTKSNLSLTKPFMVTMQSSCSNTPFDLQEFSLRMYKTGFVIQKTKDNVTKSRCIVVNTQCNFCMYREVGLLQNTPSGTSLLKPTEDISMKELLDCFQCDGALNRNFILEFSGMRTFHCTALSALDALYLVTGLKAIADRVKYDEYFFQQYAQPLIDEPSRFAQNSYLRKMAANRSLPPPPSSASKNGSSNGSVSASPARRWFGGNTSGRDNEDERSVASTPSSVYVVSSKNNTPQSRRR